jgi:hypothetical protein
MHAISVQAGAEELFLAVPEGGYRVRGTFEPEVLDKNVVVAAPERGTKLLISEIPFVLTKQHTPRLEVCPLGIYERSVEIPDCSPGRRRRCRQGDIDFPGYASASSMVRI